MGIIKSDANNVFISLGSNLGNARECLAKARASLASLPRASLGKISSIYVTEPQEFRQQPWFYNQVVSLKVFAWEPASLMRELLEIEAALGRVRGPQRYTARLIDMDMLLFDDCVSDNPECILPHPRLTRRAFALVPLGEVAPEILINGKTPSYWLSCLSWRKEGQKIFQ